MLIINYLGARLTNQKFITIIQMRDDGDLKYSESEGGGVNLRHERTNGTKQTNKNYRTRDKTLLEQSLILHHTVTFSPQCYSSQSSYIYNGREGKCHFY